MNRSACVSLALASLLVCAPARAAIVLLGGNHGVIGIDSGTEQCTVVEETPFTVDGLAVEDVADLFVDASGLTYFLTATFDPSLVARASLVPTALFEPDAIGFCPDGQLLVAGFEGTTPKLVRYDPDEGSFSDCSESLPNVTITGFGRVSCASSSCDAVMNLDALALDGDRVFRNECQYTLRATFDPDAILVEPSGSVLVTGQFQEGADPDFVFIGGILRFDACPGPASQQLSLPAPYADLTQAALDSAGEALFVVAEDEEQSSEWLLTCPADLSECSEITEEEEVVCPAPEFGFDFGTVAVVPPGVEVDEIVVPEPGAVASAGVALAAVALLARRASRWRRA